MGVRAFRLASAITIAYLPANRLRCLLYRLLFGYTIRGASIGWGTIILVRGAQLEGCSIGRFNRFYGPVTVTVGRGTRIGNHNTFVCGFWTKEDIFRGRGYQGRLTIGADALITEGHFFDVAGSFTLGDGSWIAGRGSQFWTHGAGAEDRDISIGSGSYIGSAVRFAPGSCVGDNVIVGIGSVVVKKFPQSNAMIAGLPAKIIREAYDYRTGRPLSRADIEAGAGPGVIDG